MATEHEHKAVPPAQPANVADLPTIGRAQDGTAGTLVRILDQCLVDLQAGQVVDRARLLAEYPELATQLEACLAGIEFIHRAATPAAVEGPAQLGDFRVLVEVGRGGMGVVYQAEQMSLRRKVALKVLRFGGAGDDEAMKRFRREAETVARLHHTNIVPIFAIGEEHGVHYYAMQFIEGRSLADVLAEVQQLGRPTSSDDVARWGLQAAEALAHAHQRGVIHRDIKPSNLLLDTDGTVWLTDFGLAKQLDEVTLTMSGALMGTPRYMSPEQAEALKRPVDHRTDIYSLGASLYELATARPVFEAQTPHGVISQILMDDPVPPRQIRPDLPRDLETIILTCLAKDPARRYETAEALAVDLRAFLEGRAIKARRATLPERAARFVRKQKTALRIATATAAVSALVMAGSVAAWSALHEARLGRIALTTDETAPHFTAEILDGNRDDPVLEPFTVPTKSPVALPEGSYRVRLSAAGQLSETGMVDVERGVTRSFAVRLGERKLWEQILPQAGASLYAVAVRGGRTDLVERDWSMVRRRDGATGKELWSVTLDASTLPAGTDPNEWSSIIHGSSTPVHPAPDLDGDGTGDLVWACRAWPALLALSGADGHVLWLLRVRPEASSAGAPGPKGGVVDEPLATDVNGDGTPDLVTLFSVQKGDGNLPPNAPAGTVSSDLSVEAVSGRDGRVLWRRDINVMPLETLPPGVMHFEVRGPQQIRLREKTVVAITGSTRWVGLDPATGEPIGPPISVNLVRQFGPKTGYFTPVRPTQYADLDGDGQPEAIVLGDGDNDQEQILGAFSLIEGKRLWSLKVRAPFFTGRRIKAVTEVSYLSDWPLAADLDGDGKAEVVVPDQEFRPPGQVTTKVKGLRVLDGKNGQVRWTIGLRTDNDWTQVERYLDGPDLDNDGVRELFVASFVPRALSTGPTTGQWVGRLYVDALSGKTGRRLWWWGRDVGWDEEAIGSLRWWGRDAEGRPYLVVTNGSFTAGGQPTNTYILATASGQLVHIIPGVNIRGVADLDGDTLEDLWGTEPTGGGGRTLHAYRGGVPEAWRRLGRWIPAEDFDGDGYKDLLNASGLSTVAVASGRDGHVLWRADSAAAVVRETREYGAINVATMEGGRPFDIDRDGHPDAVAFETRSNVALFDPQQRYLLGVLSGRTGRPLWSAGPLPQGVRVAGHLRACGLMYGDVAQNGGLDLLALREVQPLRNAASGVGPPFHVRLARISAKDGRVLFDQPVTDLSVGGSALALPDNTGLPMGLADLAGDTTQEVVVLLPGTAGWSRELVTIDGRDGHVLWRKGLMLNAAPGDYGTTPYAIGDLDGDGKNEVVAMNVQGPDVQVLALNGSDGKTRWTWSGEPGHPLRWSTLPPVLADPEGNKRLHTFMVAQQEGLPRQVILLGPSGQVRERRALKSENASMQARVIDLDGDGRSEMFFEDEGKTWVTSGSLTHVLWSRPGTHRDARVGANGRPATVVMGDGVGVEGLTGVPLWGSGPGEINSWIVPAGTDGRPRVLVQDRDVAVIRKTEPIAASGRYVPEPPAHVRRSYPTPDDDPRFVRRIPFASADAPPFLQRPWELLGMGLYSAAAVLLPLGWIARAVRRRQIALKEWLLVPPWCAAMVLVTRAIGLPPYLSSMGPAWQGVAVLIAMGLPVAVLGTWLVVWLWRRRWKAIALTAALAVVLALGMAIWWMTGESRTMGPDDHFAWDGWPTLAILGTYLAGVLLGFATVARLAWRGLCIALGALRPRRRAVVG
jgi:hypothetical protein